MEQGDINRAARYLIDQYGEKASPQAQDNLDWAKARSDAGETKDWVSILKAIADIQTVSATKVEFIEEFAK
jgi:hypothetical protein